MEEPVWVQGLPVLLDQASSSTLACLLPIETSSICCSICFLHTVIPFLHNSLEVFLFQFPTTLEPWGPTLRSRKWQKRRSLCPVTINWGSQKKTPWISNGCSPITKGTRKWWVCVWLESRLVFPCPPTPCLIPASFSLGKKLLELLFHLI